MNTNNKGKKAALGLSGGVDSSVSAYLLLEQGYEVTGVFMQCWDAKADGCKSDEDRAYAVEVAAKLGIKFEHLDFREAYKTKVMDYFYKEYQAGRTPNPDVMCNKEIKFGLFFDWAMENGFDYVATGHYARVQKNAQDVYELLKGVDAGKDQSYFLYLLGQKQLSHTLFPIGDLDKPKVRKLAKKADLPTYNRPDSVGICFIGEVNIKDFLKKTIKSVKGDVYHVDGRKIGTHDGVWFYTVGQRHGFDVSTYFGHPLYVVSKDIENNKVIVGEEKDAYVSKFNVTNLHWLDSDPIKGESLDCDVRIRHLGQMHKAKILHLDTDTLSVELSEPIFAVAAGQSAVFYNGDVVLGGGIIL